MPPGSQDERKGNLAPPPPAAASAASPAGPIPQHSRRAPTAPPPSCGRTGAKGWTCRCRDHRPAAPASPAPDRPRAPGPVRHSRWPGAGGAGPPPHRSVRNGAPDRPLHRHWGRRRRPPAGGGGCPWARWPAPPGCSSHRSPNNGRSTDGCGRHSSGTRSWRGNGPRRWGQVNGDGALAVMEQVAGAIPAGPRCMKKGGVQ